MIIDQVISDKIKTIRKDKLKISQVTAAERLYMSLEAYQRFELGKTKITVDRLWDFCQTFGVHFCDVLPEALLTDAYDTVTDWDPIMLIDIALSELKKRNNRFHP